MFKFTPPPPAASLLALLLLASACEQSQEVVPDQLSPGIDSTKVQRIPTTSEEKKLVANLEKVTKVFKEIYKSKENVGLVKAAIYSKVYTDESILLKDLLFPDNSLLVHNKKFISLCRNKNLSLAKFS